MSPIIWGLTPRKMNFASRATAALSMAMSQSSSSARATALSSVRSVSTTCSGRQRQAARASAPPMLPAPMNPKV